MVQSTLGPASSVPIEPIQAATGRKLSISVGVACLPDDAADPEGLLTAAEAALRGAKRGGPGRVHFFSAGDTIVVDLSSTPRVATSAGAERLLAAWLRTVQGVVGRGDLSVRFRAADGAPLDRPLSRAVLDRDHPFNTYKVRGLRPAPIAAPGLAALQAVTRPAASDDLYFVADGTGRHAFARTLDEHNRNVARWREIERRRAAGL